MNPLGQVQELRHSVRKHGVSGALRGGSDTTRRAYAAARALSSPRANRRRRAEAGRYLSEHPDGLRIAPSEGFLALPPHSVVGAAELAEAASRVVEATPGDRLEAPHNTGLLDPDAVGLDSPFLRFALSGAVLTPVIRHLGVIPVLRTVDVWESHHTGQEAKGSRLYHCDGDDTIQVKVFIHSTDVGERSGPLTVIGAEHSETLRKAVQYRYRKPRVDDDDVRNHLGSGKEVALTGPAGTVAFVDTSACFHFGSRVEAGVPPRILTMLQYTTPVAFTLPRDYSQGAPFAHLGQSAADAVERLVLGAE